MTASRPTDLPAVQTALSDAQRPFSERAQRVIPGGSHTYSRGDDQFPANAPRAFVRGKGARVWSLTGDEYVDWGMGINNVLIGHAEDAIDDAAVSALRNGQALSRPTPLEVELAECLIELFPGMEMVKFAKNGSDANSAAIRLARAITGRDLIAYDADAPFLSIHDWFIGTTVMNAGVPEAVRSLSIPFSFNDLASVEQLFAEHDRRIAAVILEVCRERRPEPGFLQGLRELCDAQGTILIFDEIVTGFRYAAGGAHTLFGVRPDLMTLGKGMANGYSLAALVGPRNLMERGGLRHDEERVFLLSTTFGPEQSALAAALACLKFYRQHDVVPHLYGVGQRVIDGVAESAHQHGILEYLSAASDFACRPTLRTLGPDRRPSAAFRTLFLQELLERKVFMPWVCPSYRHSGAEVDRTLEAVDRAAAVYARAVAAGSTEGLLRGPAIRPVFRKFSSNADAGT